MLPSCFEVTHPILIRLSPKSDPNRGGYLGTHHPACVSGLRFPAEAGHGPPSRWLNAAQQKGLTLFPFRSLHIEATFLTICFYNVEEEVGAGDEPESLPTSPSIIHPRWQELTGKA